MISLHPTGYRVSRAGKVLRVERGSTEHFYHFLLGYILPTIWLANGAAAKIRVLDCGPSMNPRLEEALDSCGVDWEYWRGWKPWTRTVVLPRWDLNRVPFADFQMAIRLLSRRLDFAPECGAERCALNENIFLLRSPQPAFYGERGPAIIKGYGIGRRSISNTSEILNRLTASEVPFSTYEPGAHTLRCQMSAFRSARRVFGIRGAEWANLIWMSNASKVCVVYDRGNYTPLAPPLARDLGISLEAVYAENGRSCVDPITVEQFFLSASPSAP